MKKAKDGWIGKPEKKTFQRRNLYEQPFENTEPTKGEKLCPWMTF